MGYSRRDFFLLVLFFSVQGFSENHQEQWSKTGFIDSLSNSRRTTVAHFSEKLHNIWKRLKEEKLSKRESLELESAAKTLQETQEIYLKTVQKYKKDLLGNDLDKAKVLTNQKAREAKKYDKLIGMYQANITELDSVLKAIQEYTD